MCELVRQKQSPSGREAKDRKSTFEALLNLPQKLIVKSSFEIHRMGTSTYKNNPASTLDHDISLYDLAFRPPPPLDRILAHELAHLYWNGMSSEDQQSYRTAANWISRDGSGNFLPGRTAKDYVEPDGMNSPSEDFANNLEYMLFDHNKLKRLTPSLFNWLHSFLGDNFKLGGTCAQPIGPGK